MFKCKEIDRLKNVNILILLKYFFKNVLMLIMIQVLNNRMFNPLKTTEENGNIEHNGNKNDNYMDDDGKIQFIY